MRVDRKCKEMLRRDDKIGGEEGAFEIKVIELINDVCK